MGSLRNLSDYSYRIHILYTDSGKAYMYIYDRLRESCNADRNSIYEIQTRADVRTMEGLVSMQPYLADRWLFIIDYKKVKGMLKNKMEMFSSESSCFLIRVSSYKEYVEFKELVGQRVNDMYFALIRKDDVYFLLKDFELSDRVKGFVAKSYIRDVEKVFDLKDNLSQGAEINAERDVIKLVGASSGSVVTFVLSLFNEMPGTEKGFKMVCRRRLQSGVELGESYGYRTFRNYINSAVYDMLQIKMLYLNGVIYNRVMNLPEGFEEDRLRRYDFCLEKITKEIPYERLALVYFLLQKDGNRVWYSGKDLAKFLYDYYLGGLAEKQAEAV